MKSVTECQSCAMPMKDAKDFGTEKGGGASADYCCHCYKDGDFTWTAANLDEAVESNIGFWEKEGDESDADLRARVKAEFSKLKRWKTA